jgi:hypothetical protein
VLASVSQQPSAKGDGASESVFPPVDGAGKVKSGFRRRHILDLVTHSALPLQLGKTLAAQACPGKLLYAKEPAICGWVIDIPQWIYHHPSAFVLGLDECADGTAIFAGNDLRETGIYPQLPKHRRNEL